MAGLRRTKAGIDRLFTASAMRDAVRRRLGAGRTEATVLCYHDIRDEGRPGVVSWDAFRMQMDLLQKQHRLVTLSETVERVRTGHRGESRDVAITFDDGWKNAVLRASAELNARHIPFTHFVVAQFCEGSNEDDLFARREEVLAALGAFGSVGGHGVSHAQPLTSLGEEALRMEMQGTWEFLERLGVSPTERYFCYPWARHDNRVERLCAATGFSAAFGSPWKRFSRQSELMRLGRITIDHDDDLTSFSRKMLGARDWQGAVGFSGKWLRPWVN